MIVGLFFIVAIVSYLSTWLVRRYAINRGVIDFPNDRSSHTSPTPRGGGLSIVLSFSLALIYLSISGYISLNVTLPLLIAGLLTSIVGFFDDKGHIRAGYRLVVHFISAGLLVYASNGLPNILFFGISIDFGLFGWVLGILASVWILNLYNFMDGIDGIASIEAISSCFVMALLIFWTGNAFELGMLHLILMITVVGFLFWNFPPAKIFMGDAGSGFLGLMLAGLILQSAVLGSQFFWAWMIMLGVFIVDATYTLIVRLMKGFKPYDAHRSHAYQIASRMYCSHRKVTLSVLAINLFWLAPLAFFSSVEAADGFTLTLIAYLPLVIASVHFKSVESKSEI